MNVQPHQDSVQLRPRPAQGSAFQAPGATPWLKYRRWIVGGGALILVLGGYWYYAHGSSTARRPRLAAAPVRVATAQRREMAVVERTIGTVVAYTTVQLTARIQGVIDTAYFQDGQLVKKGDLLFQIDPRAFQAALAQARAQLAKDQATHVNDVNNERRYRTLYAQNATSSQQLDSAVATAAASGATVQSDQAMVDTAQLNLGYTQIRSPVDGKTGPVLVQPGNMVAANGTTTLVTINQIRPIKVSFFLPQSDLPRIQARQRSGGLIATIDQQDAGGQVLSAPVTFISNSVNNTSGTIELRATFDNTDSSLVPGQLVNTTIALNSIPNATVVPHEAVNNGPDGQYVYVVNSDSKAMGQNVKVLYDDGANAAVQGDVAPGDQVVVDGQLRLVPGVAVFVETDNTAGTARPAGRAGRKGKGARRSAK